MAKLKYLFFPLLLTLIIFDYHVVAGSEKRSLDISLQVVHKDTPYFKRSEERKLGNGYLIKMVKIRDNTEFVSLPKTQANVLYYGEVKLGMPERNHGVLIDFEGKEKLLWVDSDADKDYAEETCYQIFKSDRYPGVNVYYSPSPINFLVQFKFDEEQFEVPLQFDLPFLAIARTGYQDLFFLTTRSWFTGSINIGNTDLRVALVDTNDNGFFQDPDDLVIFDKDYDLSFSPQESSSLKRTKNIKLGSSRWNIQYDYVPKKLTFKER